MMTVAIEPLAVPLRLDDTGTFRVGGTRVTLDVFLGIYEQEGSAEGVVEALDMLDLADAHAVLAWCLRHPEEVATYLHRRKEEAKEIRARLAAEQPPRPGFRAELQARWARRENPNDAPPGQ
jgi:hypothetical protein